MKIAFFIDGIIKEGLDLSSPNFGNPGVGGTQFCFILLIENLLKLYCDVEIIVFSLSALRLPNGSNNIIVSQFEEVLYITQSLKCDFLLLKTPMNNNFYKSISHSKVKIICWSHNYFNAHIANEISNMDQIVANVFVSKQMYDFYYDHNVIRKSLYIFNIVPDAVGECERKPIAHSVVYMGSLIKQKGIIELFKIWRIIEKKYPNAILHIIGSGQLYTSSSKLGSKKLASADLESEMENYILDKANGSIKKNIIFHGIKGQDKYSIFLNTSVGIVNPSANTETFGMGIIEMASAKLPVVTKKWNGHPDTAINGKTALLSYTINAMANNVLKLFEDERLNNILGENAKKQVTRFSPNEITPIWYNLFNDLQNNSFKFKVLPLSRPFLNNYKFIRYINSFLRFQFKLTFLPSIVSYETFINNVMKKLR